MRVQFTRSHFGYGIRWVQASIYLMWVHIGATWQIRLNHPCEAAMWHYCQDDRFSFLCKPWTYDQLLKPTLHHHPPCLWMKWVLSAVMHSICFKTSGQSNLKKITSPPSMDGWSIFASLITHPGDECTHSQRAIMPHSACGGRARLPSRGVTNQSACLFPQ